MFRNYLKTTIRNLWKNKVYGFLNIFGLAIGVTCAGLIFLWVENEYTYDQYNTKKDYLYWIRENQAYNGKIYTFNATPGLMAPAIKTEIPGVANTARATWDQSVLFSIGDKSIYESGSYADSSIFSMMTIPFVQGNPATVFNQL